MTRRTQCAYGDGCRRRKLVVAYRNEIRIAFAFDDDDHDGSAERRQSFKACSTSETVTDATWFHYQTTSSPQGQCQSFYAKSNT
jgi:hypothetical protein